LDVAQDLGFRVQVVGVADRNTVAVALGNDHVGEPFQHVELRDLRRFRRAIRRVLLDRVDRADDLGVRLPERAPDRGREHRLVDRAAIEMLRAAARAQHLVAEQPLGDVHTDATTGVVARKVVREVA
jgi:hypothetical protein